MDSDLDSRKLMLDAAEKIMKLYDAIVVKNDLIIILLFILYFILVCAACKYSFRVEPLRRND